MNNTSTQQHQEHEFEPHHQHQVPSSTFSQQQQHSSQHFPSSIYHQHLHHPQPQQLFIGGSVNVSPINQQQFSTLQHPRRVRVLPPHSGSGGVRTTDDINSHHSEV